MLAINACASRKVMAKDMGHVHTELVEVLEAGSRLMVICMDHVTSLAVNIIDEGMGLALARAVLEAEWYTENDVINGVVLCSGKHQSFLAGADILFEQKMTSKVRWVEQGVECFISKLCVIHSLQGILCYSWVWQYNL